MDDAQIRGIFSSDWSSLRLDLGKDQLGKTIYRILPGQKAALSGIFWRVDTPYARISQGMAQ